MESMLCPFREETSAVKPVFVAEDNKQLQANTVHPPVLDSRLTESEN